MYKHQRGCSLTVPHLFLDGNDVSIVCWPCQSLRPHLFLSSPSHPTSKLIQVCLPIHTAPRLLSCTTHCNTRKHSLEEEDTPLTCRWEQAELLSSGTVLLKGLGKVEPRGSFLWSTHTSTSGHGFQARVASFSNCPRTHRSPNAENDSPALPSLVGTATVCSSCFQLKFFVVTKPFQRAALALPLCCSRCARLPVPLAHTLTDPS